MGRSLIGQKWGEFLLAIKLKVQQIFLTVIFITIINIKTSNYLWKMYIITYIKDLMYFILNKKIGRNESDSKEKKNLFKYPTFLDLSFLGQIYESETFIRKKLDKWIPHNTSMKYFSDRIKTFKKWPKQIKQTPQELAEAGFYYTQKGDTVRCFYCGLFLHKWEKEDNVISEHRRHGFTCKFIRTVYG